MIKEQSCKQQNVLARAQAELERNQLAMRLAAAEAIAIAATKECSQLAMRLQTAEAKLAESSDYATFLMQHIATMTPTPSPSPQTSAQSVAGTCVPDPFSPFH